MTLVCIVWQRQKSGHSIIDEAADFKAALNNVDTCACHPRSL